MDPVISAIVTVGGLLFAALNFVQLLAQNRGKRFYERSTNLLDLRERLSNLGPLTGELASSFSAGAHQQLLADYEREARANAALYVAAVSRLDRPGSYLSGFASLAYAVPMAFITGSAASQLLPLGPLPVIVVAGLPFLATVALAWSGARLVLRRASTAAIRRKMGEIDPLSIEGLRRFVSSLAVTVKSLIRWPTRKSASPAPANPMP
jgi:hypothetical protein